MNDYMTDNEIEVAADDVVASRDTWPLRQNRVSGDWTFTPTEDDALGSRLLNELGHGEDGACAPAWMADLSTFDAVLLARAVMAHFPEPFRLAWLTINVGRLHPSAHTLYGDFGVRIPEQVA